MSDKLPIELAVKLPAEVENLVREFAKSQLTQLIDILNKFEYITNKCINDNANSRSLFISQLNKELRNLYIPNTDGYQIGIELFWQDIFSAWNQTIDSLIDLFENITDCTSDYKLCHEFKLICNDFSNYIAGTKICGKYLNVNMEILGKIERAYRFIHIYDRDWKQYLSWCFSKIYIDTTTL